MPYSNSLNKDTHRLTDNKRSKAAPVHNFRKSAIESICIIKKVASYVPFVGFSLRRDQPNRSRVRPLRTLKNSKES